MTEQFKTTAEYRHWICRHDLEELAYMDRYSALALIRDVLPPLEKETWGRVCDLYAARELPAWFIKEVGELNDY